MRKLAIGAVALALSGCGLMPTAAKPIPTPEQARVTGSITVRPGLTYGKKDAACILDDGYADIRAAAQVTVTDENGSIVGLGQLNEGKVTEAQEVPGGRSLVMACNGCREVHPGAGP